MSDDPFDDLGDEGDDIDRDADGDPFEDLEAGPQGGDTDEEQSDGDADEEWASDEESLFSDAVDPSDSAAVESDVGTGGSDPFEDLDRGPREGAGGVETDDPFEEFEQPESDPFEDLEGDEEDLDDTVWDDLSVDPEAESLAEQREGRKVSDVSKHRFCEQCPHFTGPPETRCTFDGAEIVEFVDMETVRLVNCPVVAEQEELGEDVTRYESE